MSDEKTPQNEVSGAQKENEEKPLPEKANMGIIKKYLYLNRRKLPYNLGNVTGVIK